MDLNKFKEIWFLGVSAEIAEGENPNLQVLVAQEYYTGRKVVVSKGDFKPEPPFDIGETVLVVAFYASIEMGAFLSQGWSMPANLLDLFAAFGDSAYALRDVGGLNLGIAHGFVAILSYLP